MDTGCGEPIAKPAQVVGRSVLGGYGTDSVLHWRMIQPGLPEFVPKMLYLLIIWVFSLGPAGRTDDAQLARKACGESRQ
jgi:hypothetical protein